MWNKVLVFAAMTNGSHTFYDKDSLQSLMCQLSERFWYNCTIWWSLVCFSTHTLKIIKPAATMILFSQSWTLCYLAHVCFHSEFDSCCHLLIVCAYYLQYNIRFVTSLSHSTYYLWFIIIADILELMLGCFAYSHNLYGFSDVTIFLAEVPSSRSAVIGAWHKVVLDHFIMKHRKCT